MKRYRLTISFALTAVAVITIAVFVVNGVIGGLAERNLIRIAEENTVRDAVHVQAMMRTGQHVLGQMAAGSGPSAGSVIPDQSEPTALNPRVPDRAHGAPQ